MVSWCLVLAFAASTVTASNATKKTRDLRDAVDSASEFFPQYSGFQPFAVQPPILPAHDLTPLQQTHVLGNFQHRFQPQRFGPPPGFQNQPLLFSQHTEFGDPPRHISQNIVSPAQSQPPALFPPTSHHPQPPPPPPPRTFGQDPRQHFNQGNVKFPSSQEHFTLADSVPNQRFRQSNVPLPQQPASPPQFTEQHRQNNPSQQFHDQRNQQFDPSKNQQFANNEFTRNQQSFGNAPRPPFEQFRNPSLSNNNQAQFNPATQQFTSNNQQFSHRNPAIQPQAAPQGQNQFSQQPNFSQQTFERNNAPPQQPAPPVLTQPSISFQPQPTFNNFQQNFPQTTPSYQFQHNTNSLQKSFSPNSNEPQVSFNPNRRPAFLPTPSPKEEVTNPTAKRPLLPFPTDLSSFNSEPSDSVGVQKSQEGNYIHKTTKVEFQPSVNDLPNIHDDEYRRTTPKPIVQEITINLATTAKPDKVSKKEKSANKEKTQEELINEQIHKLLQQHNIETGSGENLPIPELPADLKDKYQIKLVNSEVLGELTGKKKKKEKTVTTAAPELPPLPDLPDHIKKQYEVKLVRKDELFKQFKIGEGGKLVTNTDLVDLPGSIRGSNETTSVFLANGQQLQILNFPKGGQIADSVAKASSIEEFMTTTTTSKPPDVLLQELAQGVVPAGANIELIKHNANGEVEKVKDITSAKKVTFVLLEEQPDGSVKIQGVKGNGANEKSENETVESILKKIKEGTLKLPPSEKSKVLASNEITSQTTNNYDKSYVTVPPTTERDSNEAFTTEVNTFRPTKYSFSVDTIPTTETPDTTPFIPTASTFLPKKKPKSKTRPNYLSTFERFETTTKSYRSTKKPSRRRPVTTTTTAQYEYEDEDYNQRSSNYNGEGPIPQDVVGQESNIRPSPSLITILQEYGLYEMSKFLDQSGLDTILNETGPYTIFIPTDAAFTLLQEQLGGADKAQDKFRENPRLLSGLLLHHVVPGSFKVSDLQDEMTGVSLAGTQLRVNTYNAERKDPIVTINGAVVSASKRDIPVPQGLAHAVDRVLFPLPVGDLVQSLKGDRERRFNKFIKSIEASGLEDLLTGSKTYTVFAPTDAAFTALTDAELDKLLTRREAARTIVLRHIMPGTLYSAGMHFYQIKESMERGQKITIQKELGKVKANSVQVKTANIPATNGVIHVVDSLL